MNGRDEQHALLTRLAAQHPDWTVRRTTNGDRTWTGWVATRGTEVVTADSLPQLECELAGR